MTKQRHSPFLFRRSQPLILAAAIVLSACGGGSDLQAAASAPAGETPAQAIKRLEDSGQLPVLDRSADLKGPDTDNNGIRDDIDAYIAKQNYTPAQLKAVQQHARYLQATLLVNLADPVAVQAVSTNAIRAINCLHDQLTEPGVAYKTSRLYLKYTFNTEGRTRAYLKYNDTQNGTVTSWPEGNTCDN